MERLKFQMAWANKEEDAIEIVIQHMRVMDEDSKEELCNLYTCLIFPRQNHTWDDIKWTNIWGVTFVTMWRHEHLLQNLKLAMIQEHMGIGPTKYCIVNNWMLEFENNFCFLSIIFLTRRCVSFLLDFLLRDLFHVLHGGRLVKKFVSVPFVLGV